MNKTSVLLNFATLRYEYYVAGRTLCFNDLSQAAGIMMGYAVESSLKSLLHYSYLKFSSEKRTVKNENKFLVKSHDLVWLYEVAERENLLSNIVYPKEFLDYANVLLNRRYPRDLKRAVGGCPVLCFDDLIIQLDEAIFKQTNNESANICLRAYFSTDSWNGRMFFHCNNSALVMFETYAEKAKKLRPNSLGNIEILDKGPEHLWDFKDLKLRIWTYQKINLGDNFNNFSYEYDPRTGSTSLRM